jgi:hypothetical protein
MVGRSGENVPVPFPFVRWWQLTRKESAPLTWLRGLDCPDELRLQVARDGRMIAQGS